MSTAIVLFRRDLRVVDNPALSAASAAHAQVLPVYVHAPAEDGAWAAGAASRWWLHRSLDELGRELLACGSGLHLRLGDTLAVLQELIERSGATAVYWNRLYTPAAIARDTHVKTALQEQGIAVHSYNAALWCEPWEIATGQGGPYRVFTPYWRKLRASLSVLRPLPAPRLPGWTDLPHGLPLAAFDLRDLPARHGTSRLSPHLHFGEISPRQIHFELDRRAQARDVKRRPDIEPYLRELGWREFAHHVLYHFPHTPTDNFNPRFDGFGWAPANPALRERWQQGRTGIPLVDAGMRELWHTGWMHNRVRMIVGSFLTKNLRQHWLYGARWFWDTLVDADLANNTLGWQWVAGCGADAAPYFRVFNPVTQAKKFDPDGAYLRSWLPELVDAPVALLHEPWKDQALLRRSGYPAPMVDLGQSRLQALAAYGALPR